MSINKNNYQEYLDRLYHNISRLRDESIEWGNALKEDKRLHHAEAFQQVIDIMKTFGYVKKK